MKEKGQIKEEIPQDTAFIGALSLDGNVVKVEGMLPALIAAAGLGFKRVFLPYDLLIPIDMLEGIECIVIHHINDLIQYIGGQVSLPFHNMKPQFEDTMPMYKFQMDFCHIIGHEHAKQALEIAASGGHNVLMSGLPGCGKSLLAETFPSILPSLTKKAQLEVMSLYQQC